MVDGRADRSFSGSRPSSQTKIPNKISGLCSLSTRSCFGLPFEWFRLMVCLFDCRNEKWKQNKKLKSLRIKKDFPDRPDWKGTMDSSMKSRTTKHPVTQKPNTNRPFPKCRFEKWSFHNERLKKNPHGIVNRGGEMVWSIVIYKTPPWFI